MRSDLNCWSFYCSFIWRSSPFSNTVEQHLIKSFWPEIPENIDAAFESPLDDKVYIFKGKNQKTIPDIGSLNAIKNIRCIIWKCCRASGQMVWAIYGYDVAQGYPKSLSSFNLPKKVKKVDAVLYDEQTYKILFFVNNKIYRQVNHVNRSIILIVVF